jgi:DNA (cytosine-5)-methyltransferase 1
LFYEVIRLASELKPAFIILENVEGFKKWRSILHNEIENIGYDWGDAILDARDFGIPQCRRRYFAICIQRGVLFSSQYLQGFQRGQGKNIQQVFSNIKDTQRWWTPTINSKEEWRTIFSKSYRCRNDNGIPYRMDRLKGLGNSVVPQIIYAIGLTILKMT